MREIRVIPATREYGSAQSLLTPKRRVAAYARVSTDSDDQASSYEAQIDYYTTLIKTKAEWEFVDMYTDEGISGTSTARREGFRRMITDALAGTIDLIVTKSVSRFARNTVDSLTTIRKLKEKKVEVYFEKENIWTFDSKGELLITIMSSLAQEESRSISENTKWGRRKRFSDGQVSVPFSRFLGYDKGPDGNLVVNPQQAKLVRYIFARFLSGMSVYSLAKHLTDEGYKTVTGKSVWHPSTIAHMLTNEKYKGDALLQKCYIPDFLTKKPVENKGEVPQYYVTGNHEAIIAPSVFDLVQQEFKERRATHRPSIFSGRIRCGMCKGIFGSKVWHSTSKYRKVIWQCNDKYAVKDTTCTAPHISQEEIKTLYVKAVNKLISQKNEIIANFEEIKNSVFDSSSDEDRLEKLKVAHTGIVSDMERLNGEYADQEEYHRQHGLLAQRYQDVETQISELTATIQDRAYRKAKTELFLKALKKQEHVVTEFSDELWHTLVDHAEVHGKKDVRFIFKNGLEVRG
jgi:site-specific DNA recombinase